MDNLTMILADETELALEAFGLPMHAVMCLNTEDEVLEKWKLLTPENLAHVTVMLDGEAVYTFAHGKVEGQQSVVNGDGTLTVHYYMTGERVETVSDTTAEYVQAARIMLGEEE